MRGWFGQKLSHTCVIQRDSGTAQSSSGEIGTAWADVGTRKPCRYAERSVGVADEANAAVMRKQRLLLLNGTADVGLADRVVRIWDQDDEVIEAGPLTIEELYVRRDTRGRPHHTSLALERAEMS